MQRLLLIFFALITLATKAQEIDILHYEFNIGLSNKNDSVKGFAIINYINAGGVEKARLDFTSCQKNGKGMKVIRVLGRAHNVIDMSFSQSGENLIVSLPKKTKGDTGTIMIAYEGIPDDGLIISKNKFGDRTFFSDNWPDRAHHWIPCIDRPDDKASFEFIVTAPSEFKVVSNGVLIEEKAVGQKEKRTHWKTSISLPTKVMVIGVAKFAVKVYSDSPPDIPVTAWIYQKDSARGFTDYSPAPAILKFFSNYIGSYPFEKLANVQSTTIFGGMENASAIFYNEGSVTGKGNVEDLLAHEIAHQWFGDMASEKSFTHLWLSEGFATYLTNIYLEQKYGKEKLEDRMKDDRKDVIDFVRRSSHAVVDSLTPYMQLLNANSYQKGGWVLHMLRSEVGDKNFQKILKTYYQQYKGGNADTRDFETIAEKVSGRDLKWFFDQWLYRPGIPILSIETKLTDGELHVYIKQKTQPYRLNLDFWVVEADNELIKQRFLITEKESEFRIPVKSSKISFSIDPEVKLLYRSEP